MTIEDKTTKNEAAIRELIDGLVTAIRAKNIDGVMSSYASDLVAFDIVPPLQFVGATEYTKPGKTSSNASRRLITRSAISESRRATMSPSAAVSTECTER